MEGIRSSKKPKSRFAVLVISATVLAVAFTFFYYAGDIA
jgi:hypothetical protein